MVKVLGVDALALALLAGFGAGAAFAVAAQRFLSSPSPDSELAAASEAAARGSQAKAQELLDEQLSRIASFFGPEGLAAVRGAFVVVVGVGGVGSHAAHMLARSGVGRLRLVDFDNVTLSSLNRHAVATRADVGTPKVAAMRRHLQQIVPDCQVEALPVMFEASCADELLEGAAGFES